MIRHVVLLHWKQDTPDTAIAKVTAGLAELIPQIAEIHHCSFGPDLGLYGNSADYALVTDFATTGDFQSYVDDPAHQDLLKNVTGPILASWSSAQFKLH